MADSKEDFWAAVVSRLKTLHPDQSAETYLLENKIPNSFRLDQVERGKKGMSPEVIARFSQQVDISPTWIMLGIGPRKLSTLSDPYVETVLRFMEGCGERERRMIAEELGGQEKQKKGASGQERKKAVDLPSQKKAKGHL